jgi:hypothetical protein
MLNGCAFCLDLHARNARKLGEAERRIYLGSAWPEANLYTEQERPALALTDAMTRLPDTQDVPDEGLHASNQRLHRRPILRRRLDDHHDQYLQPAQRHQPQTAAPPARLTRKRCRHIQHRHAEDHDLRLEY